MADERWGVNSIDLLYNTADSSFRGAAKGEKKVARSDPRAMAMFSTDIGKSYLCPSPTVFNLFESKSGKANVVVRFNNVHFQAFQIEAGKFAPSKLLIDSLHFLSVKLTFYCPRLKNLGYKFYDV